MIYPIIIVTIFAWAGEKHFANQEPEDLPLVDLPAEQMEEILKKD